MSIIVPSRSTDGPDPSTAPLQVVSLADATAYPVHASTEPHQAHFGVVRDDGTLVESTIDDRHHGAHTYLPPDTSRFDGIESVPGEVIYVGAFHAAYGHFLLESLARLWWAADHPDLPIVWMASDAATAPTLSDWQRDMLEVLGIHNETVILTRPTRFAVLHVPDAGYKYADWSHPQQIRFLAAHEGPAQEEGSRLWLSRDARLGVGVINRDIIERRLRSRGWTIVTPELMPLREQLDAMARAHVIAGEEGSTFHTLLLLRDIRGKRFDIFRRHGPEHPSFMTIGDARQVDQHIHSCSRDAVISAEGRAVVRLAPNAAQYMSHLRLPVSAPEPLPSDWKPGPTIRRLNRLADILDAETYLQVGWRNRAAFTRVAVPRRDIVDEEFSFDVRGYHGQGASFYEVSVDEFLRWFAKGRTYDLVMLDNEHRWRDALERVRMVFSSAAHDRTVLVLSNVVPVDEIAALPDREEATRLRHASGSRRLAWQGDAYKAVLAIHDLHPELSYRTISSGGASETVIWRERRLVAPRFADEGAVGALAFPDLERHRDLFAMATEDETMAEVRDRLGAHGH